MTDYCTVDEVRLRLNIDSTADDGLLSEFVTTVSRWVDDYCRLPANGFAIAADSTRYYQDYAVIQGLLHFDAPILSVTTLKNGDATTITSSNYRLYPRNEAKKLQLGLLNSAVWVFDTDGEIEVTGKFGHSLTIPAPVTEATKMFVAWLHKRYQAGLQDATANFDLGEVTYSKPVPTTVTALLAPYVNRARLI